MSVDTLIKAVIVIALLGFAYYLYNYIFITESFETIAMPAEAPEEVRPPLRRPIEVASGGPNSPSAAPRITMPPKEFLDPMPRDPLDSAVESVDSPQGLTYPERSFGPGKRPADTAIAQAAGIANRASQLTAQSAQHFSPEMVTNGGMFFGDVAALEDENPNYTAF